MHPLPHVAHEPPHFPGVACGYVAEKNRFNVQLSDGRNLLFRPSNLTWLDTAVTDDSISSAEDGDTDAGADAGAAGAADVIGAADADVAADAGGGGGGADADADAERGRAELGEGSSGSETEIEVHSDYDSDMTEGQIAGRHKMAREAKLAYTRAKAAHGKGNGAEAAKNFEKAARLGHAEAQVLHLVTASYIQLAPCCIT